MFRSPSCTHYTNTAHFLSSSPFLSKKKSLVSVNLSNGRVLFLCGLRSNNKFDINFIREEDSNLEKEKKGVVIVSTQSAETLN